MLKRFLLFSMLLLSTATGAAQEESKEWLEKLRAHGDNCIIKRKYNSDGTFVHLDSDAIIKSCTWLWHNARETSWFALGIRAYEYKKLGRFDEALTDMDTVISYFRTDKVASTYTPEYYDEFETNLLFMRKEICDARLSATKVACK